MDAIHRLDRRQGSDLSAAVSGAAGAWYWFSYVYYASPAELVAEEVHAT